MTSRDSVGDRGARNCDISDNTAIVYKFETPKIPFATVLHHTPFNRVVTLENSSNGISCSSNLL